MCALLFWLITRSLWSERVSKDLNYMVGYLSVYLGFGIPAFVLRITIAQDYRSLHFSGTTDKLLVVYSDLGTFYSEK